MNKIRKKVFGKEIDLNLTIYNTTLVGTLSEDYLIVSDPTVCGGEPVVRGTRVPIQYIAELWDRGYSVEHIHEQYPTVPKELVKKVVELLNENRTIKILR